MIRAVFNVQKVYGGMLIGEYNLMSSDNEFNLRLLFGEEFLKNRILRLSEIAVKFPKAPALMDLTDFFIVEDQLIVILDQTTGKIQDVQINVEDVRRRRSNGGVYQKNETDEASMGFVVMITKDFLWVWSKVNGGALVRVEMPAICNGKIPIKDDVNVPCVALKANKLISNEHLTRVLHPTYECISLHPVKPSIMNIYNPTFYVNGAIKCVLGPDYGAIMMIAQSTIQGQQSFNRAYPKGGEYVYCPPWSFIDAKTMDRWQDYCRTAMEFRCRVVFMRESGFAFGCNWIAVASKQYGTDTGHRRTMVSQSELDEFRNPLLMLHAETEQRAWLLERGWSSEECIKRIQTQIDRLSENDQRENNVVDDGESTATASTSEYLKGNCYVLNRYLLMKAILDQEYERALKRGYDPSVCRGEQSRPTMKRRNKIYVSSNAQTDVDMEYFDELKSWLLHVAVAFQMREEGTQFSILFKDLECLKK